MASKLPSHTADDASPLTADECAHASDDGPHAADEGALASSARRFSEILRECKIKDEFRPACAAAFILALWRADITPDARDVLAQVNAHAARALEEAGRGELAQSLRVDEGNGALAARAPEIIELLRGLGLRSFARGHDYLGRLYETFFRHTGANTIGQYFTPRHVVAFVCALARVEPRSVVFDPACGTGGFLVGALQEMRRRRAEQAAGRPGAAELVAGRLYGIESEPATAALAVVNMLLRGVAPAGVVRADCFDLTDFPPGGADRALLNPPFPHKKTDTPPTDFLDRALASLRPGGLLAAVVPYSVLVRARDWHRRTLAENSLLFVATLPPDLFNPYASFNTAVLLLQKGVAHGRRRAFFCKVWNDGFRLKKNARVPRPGSQLGRLLEAYAAKTEIPELCARAEIDADSEEWSPEAYIASAPHTDEEFVRGFEESVREQAAFYVRQGHKLLARAAAQHERERAEHDLTGTHDALSAVARPSPADGGARDLSCAYSPSSRVSLAGVRLAPFVVSDCFDARLGGQDEIEDLDEGDVPFVSTSEYMNGVTAWRRPRVVFAPPAVTVATDGSACSSFVQEFPFYCFYKVALLRPKKGFDIDPDALYFVAYLLRRERWRYLYARKFGKKRIMQTRLHAPALPDGRPDFDTMAALTRRAAAFPLIQSFREEWKRVAGSQ